MSSWNLFLDDIRNPIAGSLPPEQFFVIARSSQAAKSMVEEMGVPSFISFDHDLGGTDTAMEFTKWLIERDMNNFGNSIPENFSFVVHSANPVGKVNIQSLLNNYLQYKKGEYIAVDMDGTE